MKEREGEWVVRNRDASRGSVNKVRLDTASRRADIRQQDRQLFSHPRPPARANGGNKGRQARLVTPLQMSEDPEIKDKLEQKRRKKKSHRVDCAGKYVAASLTDKEEGPRLCEGLQGLGFADASDRTSTMANTQQRLFVSRCRAADAAVNHSSNRRPHVLPPICQSDPLRHVPLLLPENSPPPSPCTFPDAHIHTFTVPPRGGERQQAKQREGTTDS
ncbi:hypothetical protein Q5P01_017777 [Channa striata]|uniref:Uncharacterized protein n=1 Tax=Channa striata TaxID=64152 RepID=A0AA88SJG9_CHASR|nr:hypothetical protein Q5P01_017777 [Channa striata]